MISDPLNADYILKYAGLQPLICQLNNSSPETTANILTTLIYLYNDKTKFEINNTSVIKIVKELAKTKDQRLVNLTEIFLKDVCQCE